MMSLTKMNQGAWAYYATEIASGREDYWAEVEPGRWVGRGAQRLGISEMAVTVDGLGRLFGEGAHPATGAYLGAGYPDPAERKVVAGYALTFSPPKSVSVLWATAPEETARLVEAAQAAAVDAALEYLQTHAAFTRRGRAGLYQEQTEGLVGAAFTHRTSRLGDPQLHTHVLVANKAKAVSDGRWLSLDGRELYEVQKAAGLIYKAALRAELSRRAKLAWLEVDANGAAEVFGVPEALIRAWSRRRAQVLASAEELVGAVEGPISPNRRAALAQHAAYASRPAKSDAQASTASLRRSWAAQAESLGLGYESWAEKLSRGYIPWMHNSDKAVIADAMAALAEGPASFGRAGVTEAVAVALGPSYDAEHTLARIEALADMVLSHPRIARLTPLSVTEHQGGARYASETVLAAERIILDAASATGPAVPVLSPGAVADGVARHGLGPDQARVLAGLANDGRGVSVVVGPAGTGKSKMLAGLAAAAQAEGIFITGYAPSAMAASVLTEQSGIPAETIASTARRAVPFVMPRSIVVIDEAGMARTDELAPLAGAARAAGAKVVLVGDPAQLGAVGPGGVFRLLASQAGIELENPRRFAQAWEATASLGLRARRPAAVVAYAAHGRIHSGDRDALYALALKRWWAAREAGASVVLTAPDNATVNELAMAARALRVDAGEVEPGGIALAHQVIGIGDEVVSLRNDRGLISSSRDWVRNGERWVVTDREGGSLRLRCRRDGGVISLPEDYVAQHVGLSYALTVHKAQGQTTDIALALVSPSMTAGQLYVAMTRGRSENHALVLTEAPEWDHGRAITPSPEEVMARVLAHEGHELSAHEVAARSYLGPEAREDLLAMLVETRAQIERHAGADQAARVADLAAAHQLEAEAARVERLRVATHAAFIEADSARARLDQAKAANTLRASLPGLLGRAGRRELAETAERALKADELAHHRAWALRDELSRAEIGLSESRRCRARLEEILPAHRSHQAWREAHPDQSARLERMEATSIDRHLQAGVFSEKLLERDSQARALDRLVDQRSRRQSREIDHHLGLDRGRDGMVRELEIGL